MMNEYINFIKNFIKFEFERFNIPSGHHSIIPNNNYIIIKSDSPIYNYSNCYIEYDIIRLFPFEIIIVKNNLDIGLVINFNKICESKLKLYNNYPNLYFHILL